MAYASRQLSTLIAGVGAFLQVVALWLYAKLTLELLIQNRFAIAVFLLDLGIVIGLFGVWHGLRIRRQQQSAWSSSVHFVNTLGLKFTGLGCLIETFAIVLMQVAPCVLECEVEHGIAYWLLVIGALTTNFGVVLGLTIEYAMINRGFLVVSKFQRAAVIVFMIMAFAAIWLAGSNPLVHLADSAFASWFAAFGLALFTAFVLVPLKRVMPRVGSGLGAGVVFNSVICVVLWPTFRLFVPLGLVPVILFELAVWGLGRHMRFKRAALLSSVVLGLLFGELYYPFTAYLFQWSFSLQWQLLCSLVGSVAGAYLGNRAFSSLSSAVLGSVTSFL